MWDAHRLDRGRDRSRIDERDVLADAPERDVRTEGLGVERDLVTAKLTPHAVAESQHRRGAGADPQPDDPRPAGRWKTARVVQLDVERRDRSRGCLDRGAHVSEPLFGRLPQEGQGDVHELRPHSSERGKIRGAAEHRLGDLGGEWERDEEPYPRRLERGGVRLVRDEKRDENDPEKTAEACERCSADPLAARDAFLCVGDERTHCDTRLSKERAACYLAAGVTSASQMR
jgi:hypothetical protein